MTPTGGLSIDDADDGVAVDVKDQAARVRTVLAGDVMMKHSQTFVVTLLSSLTLAACDNATQPEQTTGCILPGRPSIVAQVFEDAGTPAAIGTRVVIFRKDGYTASGKGFGDSLLVEAG